MRKAPLTLRRRIMQGLQRGLEVLLLSPDGLQEGSLLQRIRPPQTNHGDDIVSFLRLRAAAAQLRPGRAEDGGLHQPAGLLGRVQPSPGDSQTTSFTCNQSAREDRMVLGLESVLYCSSCVVTISNTALLLAVRYPAN